ncbi:ATP-dependent RNA helicase HrpA [Brackiella oedipodis]|uniref:ATP-dependent RNA helicase HrpA n=1 Tax=Brackiella oedipodis TaxID=124225 RepID=UPI000688714E|nr:ATP-dependent RNA helicase HrpA [Brackiella oedipodis]
MQKNPVIPHISYPEDLPVSAWRQQIKTALQQHQVLIISGETGSGKTTQLPKICLEAGRAQRGKIIAHTQPRRIAAVSVAKRIAAELNTEIGALVGYQIRFSDKSSANSLIKLMTDGILLAQTQHDPLLKRYDTIIIDEAHERSLNIDFLLGYLKQLLPKRPDLKVIITSATIDAQKFAQHFSDAKGQAAKVFEVSGRLYPVEVRYRPIYDPKDTLDSEEQAQRDDEKDLMLAIANGVEECERSGSGDILVFLPGEREIRESADFLQRHGFRHLEILPLYARLSQAEQDRIFNPRTNVRRVILSTNVAETSLTVPGIRFVIDSGLARVKRYSWRNKVEQLQIEPISQAAANQRVGRCGRLGPGICLRLYDEQDFQRRSRFTDPEILRSSLATVILRMKSLHLQSIEAFPFVDQPSGKAVAAGYDLLQELGALNEHNRLTQIGSQIARLPLDPRLARMLLAAKEQQALAEVLVIVAALSVQDPREHPFDAQQASQQAHAQFKDKQSEFKLYLNLWKWYLHELKHKKSQRKLQQLLHKTYLSPRRLREWHDIYVQLKTLVSELGWRLNQEEATDEQLHKALLTGLLGNIGLKNDADNFYQGARNIRFLVHPSSTFHKKAGKWIMVAELIETSRLYGHCVAKIDPRWIEAVAKHLLHKAYSDPQFYPQRGQVLINERATLYGLPIYNGRKVGYQRIDRAKAREVFIREALVAGRLLHPLPFLKKNLQLTADIERMEHKARRQDILVDDELIYAFYDHLIPQDISQAATLEKWYKQLDNRQKQALILRKKDLMQHEAAGITSEIFPKTIQMDQLSFKLSYHFEPGSPKDGVTMTVPVFALNRIHPQQTQWLVPGMLKEKVQWLLKSLPQRLRRHCVPLPDYAQGFYGRHSDETSQQQDLIDALIADIFEQTQTRVERQDFKPESLPPHLIMSFKIVDEFGRMLSAGRNLAQLKAEHAPQSKQQLQDILQADPQAADVVADKHITSWTFGELPEILEIKRGNQSAIGYPALYDQGYDCRIEVYDDADVARATQRQGLLRLYKIALKEQIKYLSKNIKSLTNLGLLYAPLGSQEELKEQLLDCALLQSCLSQEWPQNADQFAASVQAAKGRFGLILQEVVQLALQILNELTLALRKLGQIKTYKNAYADIHNNLQWLVPKDFLLRHPYAHLKHLPRYLKASQMRVDKLLQDPVRDQRNLNELLSILVKFKQYRQQLKGQFSQELEDFTWQLQELRVHLFAQELRTPTPVSVKRLERKWQAMVRA